MFTELAGSNFAKGSESCFEVMFLVYNYQARKNGEGVHPVCHGGSGL